MDVGHSVQGRTTLLDVSTTLHHVVRYLADLNGSAWIKGNHHADEDMRQRARGMQLRCKGLLNGLYGGISEDVAMLEEVQHLRKLTEIQSLTIENLKATIAAGKSVDVGQSPAEPTTPAVMELLTTKIGSIGKGIDGVDTYVLLERKDDDLTVEQAHDYMMSNFYTTTNKPGGYFCHTILVTPVQDSTNKVICTIQHRYDI